MKIKIRFFAELRDIARTDILELELPDGSRGRDMVTELQHRYPAIDAIITRCAIAINEEYVTLDTEIPANAEVGIIPPVSGGKSMKYLTRDAIRLNELMQQVIDPKAGAILVFLGTIRNHSKGKQVLYLEYEAYEQMADKMIDEIIRKAYENWSVHHIVLQHRLGRIELTEPSIAIYISSAHRAEAYAASRFLIDEIKKKVPIWKKEYFSDGSQWSPGAPVELK